MLTPYDWQEGIGNRAQYVEAKLAQGMPVLALSIPEGVLVVTRRRQPRKVFEVYDRLLMAAIGQQSDVESLRLAAIDFAHQEGFNRSEDDVTLQRVVTALSSPVKRAFADFSSVPVVARTLFAEVGDTPEDDRYALLDYDGDFRTRGKWAYIAGGEDVKVALHDQMGALVVDGLNLKRAIEALDTIWEACVSHELRPDGR